MWSPQLVPHADLTSLANVDDSEAEDAKDEDFDAVESAGYKDEDSVSRSVAAVITAATAVLKGIYFMMAK